MNTSFLWLKKYVPDLDASAKEYADAMTLTGTKVEGYERLDKNLEKIVVGKVTKIEKHPDADKLFICQVDIGGETVQIVTGATNVFAGAVVPVVLNKGKVAGGHDGSKAENGVVIKKSRMRGAESNGMLCSIEELGSTRDYYPEAPEEGIYIFEEELTPGSDALEPLGLHDVVFEYEITSNRVDCYSVVGIAREAAATFGKKFEFPSVSVKGNDEKASDYVKVDIECPDLCHRYCAKIVKNVKIAPSPKWMQRCLSASGIRPINNIVDITNFVMEEFGQPMHAYDLDTIAGRHIIVRRASDGDEFTTLDGQVRKLDRDVCMICDEEKEIGIGGIMGGENTMITSDVHTVLFEAANFSGSNIRLSAKRIGLRTDASGKFEKGLDPNNAAAAIERACHLIEELGAGEVVGGTVDAYPVKPEEARVVFEPDKINSLLGLSLESEQMLEYFKPLELEYDEKTNEVVVPSFRQDIRRTADLAEEVARFYGYDKIPATLPSGEATTGRLPFAVRIEKLAGEVARYCGFSEGLCYSFESPKVFDALMLPEDAPERKAITILNPLGEDFSIMRTLSLNGMLTSLRTNYGRRNKNARLYELGNIYIPESLPLDTLPDERMQFTLGGFGDIDFYEMKGVAEEFFDKAGLKGIFEYKNNAREYLHPGRQADIYYKDVCLGYLGEVHPNVLETYEIGDRTCIAVIDLACVIPFATFDRLYKPLAKFPAVARDISIVVPKEMTAGDVEKIIRKKGGALLESLELFDLYEGEQVREGYKSMAYSLSFRSKEKTLDETDISKVMDRILNGLEASGVTLRS